MRNNRIHGNFHMSTRFIQLLTYTLYLDRTNRHTLKHIHTHIRIYTNRVYKTITNGRIKFFFVHKFRTIWITNK